MKLFISNMSNISAHTAISEFLRKVVILSCIHAYVVIFLGYICYWNCHYVPDVFYFTSHITLFSGQADTFYITDRLL
jgi:hypothetical protein